MDERPAREEFGTRQWGDREFRLAALNLLEDAEKSRRLKEAEMTGRQRVEDELRESEARLRLALEAAAMGTFVWYVEEDRGEADARMLALFGQAEGSTLTMREVLDTILHPEDRPRYASALARATNPRGDGRFRVDVRLRLPNNIERWVALTGQAYFEGNPPRAIHMAGAGIDITQRKETEAALRQSEERLRLVLENAREYAILSMDIQRRILTWNTGAEAILGYAPEEVMGRPGDLIFTPEDVAGGIPEKEAAKALSEGRASDERWHLRKDGSRFWGSGVMTAMRGIDGQPIGLVKIFRDQTEELHAKKALEESRELAWEALQQAEQARADAEAAGHAKDHFLAVLSHELRTPLMPVMMAAQTLLRRKDLPERVHDALTMIHRNVELEAKLVGDLLDVTKIARGKMDMEREPTDVHEVLRDAVEVCRADVEDKGQRLTVDLAATAHRLVGDAARLQQAFWNLLKNAAKFTPEGGEVILRSRNEGDTLIIEVEDTGVGIEPEALKRIFDPFEQECGEVTRRFGGLGLGLAISKAILSSHGGKLEAASAGRGKGARFSAHLPLS